MALLQEIEDDGLQRLCGHGSILSYFATVSPQNWSKFDLIYHVAPDMGGTDARSWTTDQAWTLRHALALTQAARARTGWYAPRQGVQPGRHTPGDSPRRTNV